MVLSLSRAPSLSVLWGNSDDALPRGAAQTGLAIATASLPPRYRRSIGEGAPTRNGDLHQSNQC